MPLRFAFPLVARPRVRKANHDAASQSAIEEPPPRGSLRNAQQTDPDAQSGGIASDTKANSHNIQTGDSYDAPDDGANAINS